MRNIVSPRKLARALKLGGSSRAPSTPSRRLQEESEHSITANMNGYPPPMAPPAMAPPSSWKAVKTEEGKEYYYNEFTKKTQWNKPEELMTEDEVSRISLLIELLLIL